jgi:hypothetical protein
MSNVRSASFVSHPEAFTFDSRKLVGDDPPTFNHKTACKL